MDQRHERWSKEIEEAKQARTDAFMASYDRNDYTFTKSKTSRRLIAHRVAQGVPVPVPGQSPSVPAPQEQAMQRV